jgi:hypothetical protein
MASLSRKLAAAGSIAVLTGGGLFRGDVHAEDINKKTFVPFRVISNMKERSALHRSCNPRVASLRRCRKLTMCIEFDSPPTSHWVAVLQLGRSSTSLRAQPSLGRRSFDLTTRSRPLRKRAFSRSA